jgi:hypothetical protein
MPMPSRPAYERTSPLVGLSLDAEAGVLRIHGRLTPTRRRAHLHDFQGAGGAGSGVRGSRCRWDGNVSVRVLYRRGSVYKSLVRTARRLIDAID